MERACVPVTELDDFWNYMLRPYLDPVTRGRLRGVSRRHQQADLDYVMPGWMGELRRRWQWVPRFDMVLVELATMPRQMRDRLGRPTVRYDDDVYIRPACTWELVLRWSRFKVLFWLQLDSKNLEWWADSPFRGKTARALLNIALDPLPGEYAGEHENRFLEYARSIPTQRSAVFSARYNVEMQNAL